jgi:methylamine dehydrogenase heavy chain
MWTALSGCVTAAGLLAAFAPSGFAAEGAAEPPPLELEEPFVETLGPAQPHWILVNDLNALGPMDSKVYLFDADSGAMLGMLSTGGWRMTVETAPDFSMIYSPETYYPRGTRGDRTDVVTFYDARTLSVAGEAVIPPKRATGMPQRAYSGLSDDGRFVYVANMTPATSVSVVDTQARALTAEIETAGCTLVYPAGNRSFGSLCGDGTLQLITVDDAGQLASRARSTHFFDPEADPVTEKAARLGDTWYYFSFEGYVHPVTLSGGNAQVDERWSLFNDAERNEGWRVGGLGFAAIHQATRRLYVVVHRGEADTHKEPGEEIRVYDLDQRERVQTIALAAPAATVAVSRDATPLLYTTTLATPAIMVYDASSGQHLRVIEGPPFNPTYVQTP